ncbi:MAG: hypothetical protein M1820_004416 [Bogoriella megaspora]|nr:MAG: hypothetical protein M1820_004416 [Bogoriella megaspora]
MNANISVGTPAQYVRVWPSTADQQIWTVQPLGCYQSKDSKCEESRGWFFDFNKSTSWQDNGLWDLWIEKNLGYYGNANYGYDTIGLGGAGQGGPTLQNQTVAALAVQDFYLGIFGLNPKPTNFTNFSDPSPSPMQTLRKDNLIPSMSFGYSAGAKYRGFTGTLGSLTLGGYDSARFEANNLSFTLGPDNERDIVVGIRSITADGKGINHVNLLSEAMSAYIDSTVPQIWLPLDACKKFEETFGLVYDSRTELYLVNDSLHNSLLDQNPNITFTLGVGPTGGDTVDIVLPYDSFDLTASSPYQGLANSSRYFPLRRTANESQYTLGRTFLQEAYLIVDWENANFSVSQCVWPSEMKETIVAIEPPSSTVSQTNSGVTGSSSSSSLSTGAIVGIAVGAVAVIVILIILLALHYRRLRRRNALEEQDQEQHEDEEKPPPQQQDQVYPKAELSAVDTVRRNGKSKAGNPVGNPFDDPSHLRPDLSVHSSMPGTPGSPRGDFPSPRASSNGLYSSSSPVSPNGPVESDSKEREIYEMPGDAPTRQEMDAPKLSEKQAMVIRERIYNGEDPLPSPTTGNGRDDLSSNRDSGTYRSSTLAPSPVQPGDIISPVSPSDRGPLTPVSLEDRGPISPLQSSFTGFRFSFEGQPSEPSGVTDSTESTSRKWVAQ